MTNLGVCYLKGIGVEQNLQKSKQIFEQSSSKNDSEGTFYLAYMTLKEAFDKSDS